MTEKWDREQDRGREGQRGKGEREGRKKGRGRHRQWDTEKKRKQCSESEKQRLWRTQRQGRTETMMASGMETEDEQEGMGSRMEAQRGGRSLSRGDGQRRGMGCRGKK